MPASTFVDLVKVTISSTGTGTLTLGSAVQSFRGVSALVNAATYSYVIQQGSNYEVGTGVYTSSGTTFTRVVSASSNANAAISLTAGAVISFTALTADLPNVQAINTWLLRQNFSQGINANHNVADNAPVLGTKKGPFFFSNIDSNYGLCGGTDAATGNAWLQAQRVDTAATAYGLVLNPAGGSVGIGTATPAGKLHVGLETGFSWGGNWGSASATFGGATAGAGAISISYDDTSGGTIGAITPGVAWRAVRLFSDFVSLCYSGSSEGLRVSSVGTEVRGLLKIGTSSLGIVQHDGSHMYIRPTNASSLMYLGAADTNICVVQSGTFYPATNANVTLGNASFRWSEVFASNGSINTSDEREKTWRSAPDSLELDAAWECFNELGFFQWNTAIAEKGAESARFHFGYRAQRIWEIFAAHGLVDPITDNTPGHTPYSFLCYDKWEDKFEDIFEDREVPFVTYIEQDYESALLGSDGEPSKVKRIVPWEQTRTENVNTGEQRQTLVAGDTFGIRPDQLDRLMMAALKRENDRNKARITALEAKVGA